MNHTNSDYIASISENASRLGMRIQETFSEHTRDLGLGRASGLDIPEDKTRNVKKQLNSSSDREKLDAMKYLIALISKGRNMSEYFAQVVKNVASHNLEIRKLVYIFLLRYAEQEPDLALLSINTFQKDLTDSNPLIRAMALRVLSGIRVPMIGNIVVMAIKKCAADVSPYVRRVAALAIPKCYNLDNAHLPSLIEIIITLLRDRSPLCIGCVCYAFEIICPTRLDLLHQQYRRLCKILVDVDEWGQIDLLNLLLRYARTMLPRPDGEEIDKDVELLLTSSEPLFSSRNPAVILAVTRIIYYIGPPSYHAKIVHPLLHLLAVSPAVERTTLTYILAISRKSPNLFVPFFTRFFVRTSDLEPTKSCKILILLSLVNFDNHQAILREFIDYADDPDDQVVSDAILAIGRCAHLVPECTQQALTSLNRMLISPYDTIVNSAVVVLKSLVQSQLSGSATLSATIIATLARKIDDIRHPQARACVVWLVGQYSPSPSNTTSNFGPEGIVEWAPDVLRKVAKSFIREDNQVKLQTITLAAKLLVLCPTDRTLGLLARYVFSLARYDTNYDLRDRGRMLSSLLMGIGATALVSGQEDGLEAEDRGGVVLRREQVRIVLFDGKPPVVDLGPKVVIGDSIIGSLGMITGKSVSIDGVILPDWLEKGVQNTLRDTLDEITPVLPVPTAISSSQMRRGGMGSSSPVVLTPTMGSSPDPRSGSDSGKGAWVDLDQFYAEEEHGEKDEEEEEESEEDDGDSDEEDDDDNEEEEEEDEEDGDEDDDGDEEDEEEDNDQDTSSSEAKALSPPRSGSVTEKDGFSSSVWDTHASS